MIKKMKLSLKGMKSKVANNIMARDMKAFDIEFNSEKYN